MTTEKFVLICPACKKWVSVFLGPARTCYPCPSCRAMVHKAMWIQYNEPEYQQHLRDMEKEQHGE